MLARAPVTTILPVIDMDRAREFYERKLGLSPRGFAADGNFVFQCAGDATIALIPKPHGTTAENMLKARPPFLCHHARQLYCARPLREAGEARRGAGHPGHRVEQLLGLQGADDGPGEVALVVAVRRLLP